MGKANGVASAEKAAGQDSSGSAPAAGNAGLQLECIFQGAVCGSELLEEQ